MWAVSGTDEFAAWYGSLDAKDQSKVDERVELLAQDGPALRRPVVGEIVDLEGQRIGHGSRRHCFHFACSQAKTRTVLDGGLAYPLGLLTGKGGDGVAK